MIVDAVATGGDPGSLVRLEGDQLPSAFSNKMSPHQHGINDLLATLQLISRAPRRVVLLGVTPGADRARHGAVSRGRGRASRAV